MTCFPVFSSLLCTPQGNGAVDNDSAVSISTGSSFKGLVFPACVSLLCVGFVFVVCVYVCLCALYVCACTAGYVVLCARRFLVLFAPLLSGIVLGVNSLIGLLIGALISGTQVRNSVLCLCAVCACVSWPVSLRPLPNFFLCCSCPSPPPTLAACSMAPTSSPRRAA